MCITSLPYCPKRISEKIPAIIESATLIPSWDNASDLASQYAAEPTALPDCNSSSSPSVQSSPAPNVYGYGEFCGPGPAISEESSNRQSSPTFRTAASRFNNDFETPMNATQQRGRHFTAPSMPSSPSPLFTGKRRATTDMQASIPQTPPSTPAPAKNWFLCTRVTSGMTPNFPSSPTNFCTPTSQPEARRSQPMPDRPDHPANCPALEIRHPGFNGAECTRCTEAARRLCGMAAAEEQARNEQKMALREEIHRLEEVVKNMRRKLLTLEKGIFHQEKGNNNGYKKGFRDTGDRKSEWYGHGGMI